ncbi:OadG family protein [bacterium]|nr:OadG family protein [bacterium]
MNSFNIQNIIDGQAINISLTGMSIVFAGLVLISSYIALLPVILQFFSERKSRKTEESKALTESAAQKKEEQAENTRNQLKSAEDESNDIASVIGLVLQLEQERLARIENEQITLSRNSQQSSMWGNAGRMRKMPQRRTNA